MTKPNHYDNLRADIKELHEKPFLRAHTLSPQILYLTGALIKSGLYSRLIDAGFIRRWFDEFHAYWVEVLGGRPLRFHDFFYLYSDYRKRYQDIELNATQDFLETWQLPENIYSVFNAVYKYAHQPLAYYPFRKYIKEAANILEYGCGVAPITHSAIRFGGGGGKRFCIADIPSFTFHFAKWRLQCESTVETHTINPNVAPVLKVQPDLVFLMTVLEHLPDPLDVLRSLHTNLSPKGVLVFDFVLGEGEGLDSRQAVIQRREILSFIAENFVIEAGKLEIDKSMGITVARKK